MRRSCTLAILLWSATLAHAHRLDEYLQGTLISIDRGRMSAQITLTPGVAVYPTVMAAIDRDGDGAISAAEQRAYAEQVLGDLAIALDGRTIRPHLVSSGFPAIGEIREGRGEIRIEFASALPRGGSHRKLVIENRHLSPIAAYQVNALVPRDPSIRIHAQNRNYSQSRYELEYIDGAAAAQSWWGGERAWCALLLLLLCGRFAVLWVRTKRSSDRRSRTSAGSANVGYVPTEGAILTKS